MNINNKVQTLENKNTLKLMIEVINFDKLKISIALSSLSQAIIEAKATHPTTMSIIVEDEDTKANIKEFISRFLDQKNIAKIRLKF